MMTQVSLRHDDQFGNQFKIVTTLTWMPRVHLHTDVFKMRSNGRWKLIDESILGELPESCDGMPRDEFVKKGRKLPFYVIPVRKILKTSIEAYRLHRLDLHDAC